jgi:hypothetical protein
MLDDLHAALHENMGMAITPEVAARLYAAAQFQPDLSIPTGQFDQVSSQGYEFSCERLDAVLDEIHPLHEAQWLETEKYRHALPLNPDYQRGVRMFLQGQIAQFMVRRNGVAVGHMRMYLNRCMHSQALIAHEDTLFILPEHRGLTVGLHFLAYVDAQVCKLNPAEIAFDAKRANRAHVLLERLNRTHGLNYQPVATKYVRYPGADHGQTVAEVS